MKYLEFVLVGTFSAVLIKIMLCKPHMILTFKFSIVRYISLHNELYFYVSLANLSSQLRAVIFKGNGKQKSNGTTNETAETTT